MAVLTDLYQKPRGAMRSRDSGRQLVDFTGLRWGRITPTDIDLSAHRVRCSLDINGRRFAWVEFKFKKAEPPQGQWKHLQYLVTNSKAPAVGLVAEHDHPVDEDIDAAASIVRCYFTTTSRAWVTDERRTVREFLDEFFASELDARQ